jgi:hypothetical protein
VKEWTEAEVEQAERAAGAGFRGDGRFVVYTLGIVRPRDRARGRPWLPGVGIDLEITAEVKPGGEIDVSTLRVEAVELQDYRNPKPVAGPQDAALP